MPGSGLGRTVNAWLLKSSSVCAKKEWLEKHRIWGWGGGLCLTVLGHFSQGRLGKRIHAQLGFEAPFLSSKLVRPLSMGCLLVASRLERVLRAPLGEPNI